MNSIELRETSVAADAELQLRFRNVMADVVTPVTVVTAMDGARPHGTTVSAFASLSMSPPMVLVSLNRDSDLLAVLSRTGLFGVNVLAAAQQRVAAAFSRKGGDKFAGAEWSLDTAVPRLDGALGWVACSVAELVEGGDHIVVLGDVLFADVSPAAPLSYHARTFGTHVAAPRG